MNADGYSLLHSIRKLANRTFIDMALQRKKQRTFLKTRARTVPGKRVRELPLAKRQVGDI
jgi:hypothetical protein